MSINLPNAAITEFDAMVKKEYQSHGFILRDTMRTRTDVVGETIRFTVQGQGLAQQKAIQDDVVPMNIEYSNVQVNLQDWHAADYTDIFAQQEVNFDEKKELAGAIAMSIGRRSDQLGIDALAASGTANTIADGGTNFTFDKFLEANKFLRDNSVMGGRNYLAISAEAEQALLTNAQLTSTDFVRQQAIANGGLDGLEILGFTFKVIPTMTEGGLPKAGNIRTCFAYNSASLGFGIGINFRTEINYIPEKTSWLVDGLYKANAIAIDAKGIVDIDIDESA